MKFEQITPAVAYHGEGPAWDASWGGLRWVDMLAGDLLTLLPSGEIHRLATGSKIAAFVRPRVGGGFVVGLERGLGIADEPFGEVRPMPGAEEVWTDPDIRMNEGNTDPWGNLYFGTMSYTRRQGVGNVYKIGPDGEARVAIAGTTTSNGLAFVGEERAYFNDTALRRTDVFDVVGGELTNRRNFHEATGTSPDGLTTDVDGNVWVALNRVGKVRLYSPQAQILGEWDLPVRLVTSVTLGGEDGRDVFVTTSRENLTDPEPEAGAVFHARADVPGIPLTPFNR
ncbi:sugar lactone lactonase YvrE [Arcanobacterium wilhelmae]|uniref:Sugar lactone lactonase YvrE n=1 Tax=Arcanobacterium wilhelmae TaxID=1803177 RepID=A0ABT9NA73_9ACTO|nr:SMP-30/gluconolactonase/LRE family protein [Arcanobacterium wilhelmae]MDP9800591.1 sugar lactone lactonase YvrE [Arcanobacterium wilhelmae]WFN90001.1 SMP-30/gluconolactonase/LRE family protein [Arcanobacterium wilhelmae]